MELRDLKNTEIDCLARTAKVIWHQVFSYMISDNQIEYMTDKFLSSEAIKENIKNGYKYRVLIDNDEIIGFTASVKEESRIFLSKLYLKEEYHNQGLGKKMIEDVKNLYDLDVMYLTVNKNSKIIPIYKHLGFKEIDAVVIDIGNGYVMNDYILAKTY